MIFLLGVCSFSLDRLVSMLLHQLLAKVCFSTYSVKKKAMFTQAICISHLESLMSVDFLKKITI